MDVFFDFMGLAFDFFKGRFKEHSDAIAEVNDLTEKVLSQSPQKMEELKEVRERIIFLYSNSTLLSGFTFKVTKEQDTLKQVLSSARLLYWAKYLEGLSSFQLNQMFQSGDQAKIANEISLDATTRMIRIRTGNVRHNSSETLLMKIFVAGAPLDVPEIRKRLAEFEDILRLDREPLLVMLYKYRNWRMKGWVITLGLIVLVVLGLHQFIGATTA